MTKVNQCAIILNHLMRYGRMTARSAKTIGIKSFSARIKELRELGLQIETTKWGYKIKNIHKKPKPELMEDDLFPDYKPE